jgi:hypothetical protein
MHKNADHKHSMVPFDMMPVSWPKGETEHKRHKLMVVASAVTSGALMLVLALAALGVSAQPAASAASDHIKLLPETAASDHIKLLPETAASDHIRC